MQGLRSAWLAFFAFTARSLQQITTFVLTLMAARVLTPAEYGVYTLSVLFVTFLQTFIFSGFFHYVVRTHDDERTEETVTDTCFWLIMSLSVLGALLLFLAAPSIARLFNADEISFVLRFLAVVQPLLSYTAWASAMLMRQKRMNMHFNIMFTQNLLAFGIGVTLLAIWPSILALVVYRVARACTGCALYLFMSKLWPGLQANWTVAKNALRFSYPIYGTRVLTFASNYGADLALGIFFSTAEAGLYRFGNRLATGALDIVGQPMRSFALTQFGAANRSRSPLGPIVERFTSTTFILMGCSVAAIFVFGEDIIAAFFRSEYIAAVVVVYAMSVRALFWLGNFFVEPVLASTGHTRMVLLHHAIWTSVQAVATFLVASLGIGFLAWTVASISLVSSLAGFWIVSKYSNASIGAIGLAILRALSFVVAFYVLALIVRELAYVGFGGGNSSLLVGVFLSAVLGILTLIAATRVRVFDLRTFSG